MTQEWLQWQTGEITVNGNHFEYPTICETSEDFEDWQSGDSFSCEFEEETYVKVRINDSDYEAMTLSEANEYDFEEEDEN